MDPRIDALLTAWFGPRPETQAATDALLSRWFAPSPAVDRDVERRFAGLAESAANGELDAWRGTARGRLALILLFDQLPRQLHRGAAAAFAQDARALELSLTGIQQRMESELEPLERAFLCMPLQHAESLPVQELSVGTFERLRAEAHAAPHLDNALASFAEAAKAHRAIIERFGRFPHRNRYLGREDTPEEAAYLREGGPSFGQ